MKNGNKRIIILHVKWNVDIFPLIIPIHYNVTELDGEID